MIYIRLMLNSTSQPEIIEEYIEGAPTMKAAVIPVVLEYSTTNALK